MNAQASQQTKKATPANTDRDIKADAVHAALSLSTEIGWHNVSLADIAERSGIAMAEIHDHFDDRSDILVAFGRMVDRKVMQNFKASKNDSHKDQLFELLMERFDVLNENREAVISILHSIKKDPKQAIIGLPHLGKSMSWMLESAGISTTGIKGAIKVVGFSGLYLKTAQSWAKDDSEDMSKTMAALDKNLSNAEKMGRTLGLY